MSGPDGGVEIVAGQDMVEEGPPNPYFATRSCRACGVLVFGVVQAPEAGGPAVRVNVRTVDGVDLHGVPVLWLDGLHDTWAPLGTVPYPSPSAGLEVQ
ncbi:MAG: hypothetical protein H6734_16555 [Alphaproteobacteria bacterium]|nr:hypothetical protein [Alphaproteobacteria bacterium]